MKILGKEIRLFSFKGFARASADIRSYFSSILEPYTGAWQRGVQTNRNDVVSFFAVYSCINLISSDLSKLKPSIVSNENGVFKQVKHKYDKLLKKPNSYQNWFQFVESWIMSKLYTGNTYVYKEFDSKGTIVSMHVLNPNLVRVYVSDSGRIYYHVSRDTLSGLDDTYDLNGVLDQTMVIHDRMFCIFHPLVGISPIYACGLAAQQGLAIQNNSGAFFSNMSRPSGILTAPAKISPETAARLKEEFTKNFSDGNIGKLAVLGDGLEYHAMSMKASDAQMLEQLRWTAETVCSTFHVPAYKIGVGNLPNYNSAEILNQIYFTDCLQTHIESMETLLEQGLDLDSENLKFELEIDGLIRMDTAAQIETLNKSVSGGWLKPNEARQKRNLPPVVGGDTPYMQQQNYSLAALAIRDSSGAPPSLIANNQSVPFKEENGKKIDELEMLSKQIENIFLKEALALEKANES